jgi:hypothetical protein
VDVGSNITGVGQYHWQVVKSNLRWVWMPGYVWALMGNDVSEIISGGVSNQKQNGKAKAFQ